MIWYMVLKREKDGTLEYRVGGNSWNPSRPIVYDSLARARAYVKNRPHLHIKKLYPSEMPEAT